MGLLELKNITLELNGKKILDDLSADFWAGHIHAVVGPNGAGKSTLASTIMGLAGYQKISGDIIFEGRSIREAKVDERARLGITLGWQEPARYEGLKLKDFIRASAKDKSDDAISGALARSGLEPSEYMGRAVDKTLSGGERKKVELASILAMQPRVALLDEPDSGIDVESLDRIFDAVRELKAQGSTVILITHSAAVLKQAEHGFIMCCGKIIDKGPTEKILPYFEKKCLTCDTQNAPALRGE
jgi:Fe-S cluster assembly ATP-binding protein